METVTHPPVKGIHHRRQELESVVLELDGSFLVADPLSGESQEVTLTESGLLCTCFLAQVSDDPCSHVAAVQDFLAGGRAAPTLTMADADLYLSHIARLDGELSLVEQSASDQKARVDAWLERESARLDRKRRFWLAPLEGWCRDQGKPTQRLVAGNLKLRKQPVRIEVLDEDLLLQDERFRRTIPERIDVDRKALRQVVTKTGEEPEGVNVEFVPAKFSYKLNGEDV